MSDVSPCWTMPLKETAKYFETVMQFHMTLKNLDRIMEKAEAHATAKKFDVNNFCTDRLITDMLSFTRQVQVSCDIAKGTAASLLGKEAPKHEDSETSFTQLRDRIRKTAAYLESFPEADYKKVSAATEIKLIYPPNKKMFADAYLLQRSIPNFFFHVAMAYANLRVGGVDIGKMDFLGDLKMADC